jgi:hypothetical protein
MIIGLWLSSKLAFRAFVVNFGRVNLKLVCDIFVVYYHYYKQRFNANYRSRLRAIWWRRNFKVLQWQLQQKLAQPITVEQISTVVH